VLVGISRKSMIGALLDAPVGERLAAVWRQRRSPLGKGRA
jgi:hypothetical protein